MHKIVSKLTVTFDEPYWIGLYEREIDGKYEVCRTIFGSEPKDYEIYEFFNKNFMSLRFSKPIVANATFEKRTNPKQMQRAIKRQLKKTGIGTKAQQALKLQQEQGKLERRINSRERREAEKEYQFLLHQQKRKEKHRGH